MKFKYGYLKRNNSFFKSISGLDLDKFCILFKNIKELWEKSLKDSYKRPGRNYKLELTDMILMVLFYYRTNSTFSLIGFLFNLDPSRVCRNIKKLEAVISKFLMIDKSKKRSVSIDKDDVMVAISMAKQIIDTTHIRIRRPKIGANKDYSGYKHCYAKKVEVCIRAKSSEILQVSSPYSGSIHDKRIRENEAIGLCDNIMLGDMAYIGIDKIITPIKTSKYRKLTEEEKKYNRNLSSVRANIERVFGWAKSFGVIGNVFRRRIENLDKTVQNVFGLINFRNKFHCCFS